MSQQIIAISWSHHQTPLNFRDTLALSKREIQEYLHLSLDRNYILELVALPTCNRIEFYSLAGNSEYVFIAIKNLYENILKRSVPWHESAPEIYTGMEAVQHIFRIAAGMESMVLGENQIVSQVQVARKILVKSQPDSDVLSNLFNDAVYCAQTVRTDIPLFTGPTSISELAVKTAAKIYNDLDQRKVVLIGAGRTAALTARYFKESGVNNIIIANRGEKRGRALAEAISADYINICHINKFLRECDIVVTATHAENYILDSQQIDTIMSKRKKKLILIDLSTPRNMEPSICNIENICFYDLDLLNTSAAKNKTVNQQLLAKAEYVIKENSQKFMNWFQFRTLQETKLELV